MQTIELLDPTGEHRVEPFCREIGTGPSVVCTHANASTSAQWRGLMELLAREYRVFAPDSYDAGKSPKWPSDRVIRLQDEVALIEPVLERAGSPLVLVGHSFGGAIALRAALDDPARVRAIALYEPTLFGLLDEDRSTAAEASEMRGAIAELVAELDASNPRGAAQGFVDYWGGTGAWEVTPEQLKAPIAAAVTNARRWAHALFTEPSTLDEFRTLDVPVLLMTGGRSPATARSVARLLEDALPLVERVEFPELGHMGPVTHPDRVNKVIRRFLDRV